MGVLFTIFGGYLSQFSPPKLLSIIVVIHNNNIIHVACLSCSLLFKATILTGSSLTYPTHHIISPRQVSNAFTSSSSHIPLNRAPRAIYMLIYWKSSINNYIDVDRFIVPINSLTTCAYSHLAQYGECPHQR